MRIGGNRRSGSGIAAIVVAAAAIAPAAAQAGDGGFVTMPPSHSLGREAANDYWTPERIAKAEPLVVDASGGTAGAVRTVAPDPAAATGSALKSVWVRKTGKYPNRVHGKLVGTFPGVGNFSCSATVVSSESGNLVVTAGHCAIDAGGSGVFATNLSFVPGLARNRIPYGVWPVQHLITPGGWARGGKFDYDTAMLRVKQSPFGSLQKVVGSRGIGFNQPRNQRISAYGYPARGKPAYNGFKLIRCDSKQIKDPGRSGGPRGRGIKCDMKQGASGGGWVAQGSFIVSDTSHLYARRQKSLYGPYFGKTIRRMYAAERRGWPSIGPVRCGRKVATIVGTSKTETLRGTGGHDVIAALGGNDKVKGNKGGDILCGGKGKDRLIGNGGRDRLEGGAGRDGCKGGGGRNQTKSCRFGI